MEDIKIRFACLYIDNRNMWELFFRYPTIVRYCQFLCYQKYKKIFIFQIRVTQILGHCVFLVIFLCSTSSFLKIFIRQKNNLPMPGWKDWAHNSFLHNLYLDEVITIPIAVWSMQNTAWRPFFWMGPPLSEKADAKYC